MKKLLGAALVFIMGLICSFALVACSDKGDSDAEVATKAINSVKLLYADKATETPNDYTVIGQTKVGETVCPITWTVSSEVEGIDDYVSVGTMDATTKLVTVSITKADDAIDYKLTASVTVGKSTESVDFTRKVPAKPKDAAGTKEDPYSAAKVIEIANTLDDNGYFGGADEPTRVYVKGFIVDCGEDKPENNRVAFVYIVDEYSEDKTSKSPDALLILSINYDDTNLTGYADLEKGNEIMVSGYIMKYVKSGSTTAQPEITYKGDNGIACEYLQKTERTDAEKVALAKEALELSALRYTAAGEVTLPTPGISGVSFSWASDNTELVTVADGVMTIVSVPASETTVKLTATISSGDVNDTKEFTLTIIKAVELDTDHQGTAADPFSAKDALSIISKLDGNTKEYYTENGSPKEVYVKGYVVDCGSDYQGKRVSNVYIVDEYSADKDKNSEGALQVFSITYDEEILKAYGDLGKGDLIVVKGYLQKYGTTPEVTYSGNNNVNAVSIEKAVKTDAEKVSDVLNSLKVSESYVKVGEVTLPVSSNSEVILSWASNNTELVTIAEGVMTIVSVPETETEVKLTVTAKLGSVEQTKDFTIKVYKLPDEANAGAALDFVSNFETFGSDWSSSYASHEITFEQAGVLAVEGTVKLSNANKQSATITDKPVMAAKNVAQYATVESEKSIATVEFDLQQWTTKTFADIHIEYSADGETWTTCSEVITTPAKIASNIAIPEGVKFVRLSFVGSSTSNTQIGLSGINLTFAE